MEYVFSFPYRAWLIRRKKLQQKDSWPSRMFPKQQILQIHSNKTMFLFEKNKQDSFGSVTLPAPSKGCQLNPKGWWIDTRRNGTIGTPLKVLVQDFYHTTAREDAKPPHWDSQATAAAAFGGRSDSVWSRPVLGERPETISQRRWLGGHGWKLFAVYQGTYNLQF